MNKIEYFFHGRFGKKVLRKQYREIWVKFWVCVGALVFGTLFFGMIQILSWIANLINFCMV